MSYSYLSVRTLYFLNQYEQKTLGIGVLMMYPCVEGMQQTWLEYSAPSVSLYVMGVKGNVSANNAVP